ncbi:MAG: C-type lectin domain-containing protein [Hyphomicrobium sp.]
MLLSSEDLINIYGAWTGRNGHIYVLMWPSDWNTANVISTSMGGYLVKIDDAKENTELFTKLSKLITPYYYSTDSRAKDGGGVPYIWLGGSDSKQEGSWTWSKDGSSIGSSRSEWGTGALGKGPDNDGGTQNYLAMGLQKWSVNTNKGNVFSNAGQWNDLSGNNSLFSVIEFDKAPSLSQGKIVQVIKNQNDLGVYKLKSGYYAVDVADLKVGGSSVVPLSLKTANNKPFNFKVSPKAVLNWGDSIGIVSGNGKTWIHQKFDYKGVVKGVQEKVPLSWVLQQEVWFGVDINGGGIGDKISKVIDDGMVEGDRYGLYQLASGGYVIDKVGLSKGSRMVEPSALRVGEKEFTTKGTPTNLWCYTDNTFGVLSKLGTSWSLQKFNDVGVAKGAAINLKGDLITKVLYGEFLLGDHTYNFYKTVSGSFFCDTAGKNLGDILSKDAFSILDGNKAWVPKDRILAVAPTDHAYVEVLMHNGSDFKAQMINAETWKTEGAVLNLDDTHNKISAREYWYDLDLNGDGKIDPIGQNNPPSEWIL